MTSYHAFRIHDEPDGHRAGIEQLPVPEPGEGEVLIETRYSSINYKDALAGTGRGKILRRFPLTGGIDSSGVITASRDSRYREGDPVLVTGYGLSHTDDGGYAEYLKVPADWVVPLPDGLTLFEAMVLGTAGFTAALALHRMEANGQTPELGPVVVTGASGGVGCIAVNLLSARGYEVAAVSGKPDQHAFLKELGATQVLGRNELPLGERPLEKGLWGGAVDNVGGRILAGLTRTIHPGGNIASIGLAAGIELNTTVMPFIIRGIGLLGINSVDVPYSLRQRLWQELAGEHKPPALAKIVFGTVGLGELPPAFERLLGGAVHGRLVVDTQTLAAKDS
jgi:NADPH2:quinone reductase